MYRFPSYTAAVVGFALFAAVVGVARLTRWKHHRKWLSRWYTLMLITVGVAYSLVWAPGAEQWLDPTFGPVFGPNVSDSLSGLLVAATCWMLGLVLLIAMSNKKSYQIAWTAFSAVTASVMAVASRVGLLGDVEVDHEFELQDWGTTVFTMGFTLMVAGIVGLLVRALRNLVVESRPQRDFGGWAVGAMIAVSVPGAVYVGWVWRCLVVDPEWLSEHHAVFVGWTAGPALLLLGISGGLTMLTVRRVDGPRGGR